MKVLLEQISDYINLYRDSATGIAWIENGCVGIGHSCHPNIHYTGSVSGMKRKGYWNADDEAVRAGGLIYNISQYAVSHHLDELAARYCMCGGCRLKKSGGQNDLSQ